MKRIKKCNCYITIRQLLKYSSKIRNQFENNGWCNEHVSDFFFLSWNIAWQECDMYAGWNMMNTQNKWERLIMCIQAHVIMKYWSAVTGQVHECFTMIHIRY